MSIASILTEAMAKHQTGDLSAAETLYRDILSIDPGDPDALNLLGVLCLQCQKFEDAGKFIRKAIMINPTIAEYHFNLGEVLLQNGDLNTAIDSYKKSLEINPDLKAAKEKLLLLDQKAAKQSGAFVKPLRRWEIIQMVIGQIKAKTYLEIGIDSAECFEKISADRKFGVDVVPTVSLINTMLNNARIDLFKYSSSDSRKSAQIVLNAAVSLSNDMPDNDLSELYFMASDMFFALHAPILFEHESIDVAFVDGLHTYHQSYIDICNALEFMSEKGIVLVQYCNPPTKASALPAHSIEETARSKPPGWDGVWCGDVWKSILRLRTTRKDLKVFVLDCNDGMGVVCKGEPDGLLDYPISEIENMTFDDLQINKKEMLNLKPQDYLYEFLREKV